MPRRAAALLPPARMRPPHLLVGGDLGEWDGDDGALGVLCERLDERGLAGAGIDAAVLRHRVLVPDRDGQVRAEVRRHHQASCQRLRLKLSTLSVCL